MSVRMQSGLVGTRSYESDAEDGYVRVVGAGNRPEPGRAKGERGQYPDLDAGVSE